jgi:hypothetical protein
MELPPQAIPFQQFVNGLSLSEQFIAKLAQVRAMTVWRMTHGFPVRRQTANQVIVAIYQHKGKFFEGPLVMFGEKEKKHAEQGSA